MRVVPRSAVRDEWDAFVQAHPDGWFWHRNEWIDYCLEYHPGAVDRSFAVQRDHTEEVVTVVPLVQEGAAFLMGGHPGAEPLRCRVVSEVQVDMFVSRVARAVGVTRWAVRGCPQPREYVAPPGPGWQDRSWETFVVDLWRSEQELWANVRRSYHSLIRRAERDKEVGVYATRAAVETAHRVHTQAAGRETRSQATWDRMARWAESGNLLVALVLSEGKALGMAMAVRYKNASYYASGATLEPNLSHALVWRLATTLRYDGLRWFEVGWGVRPGDTEKDRNIAYFKKGMGGEAWVVPAREVAYA